jgi:hypothetical protein
MANKKQPYNWKKVRPGDIISFRYKTESTGKTLVHSILVLNPKLPVSKKDNSSTFHMVGIKLEQSNKINLRLNAKQLTSLEKIGEFVNIDEKNNLYKLRIDESFILNDRKGVKEKAYKLISKNLNISGQYRTYDWKKAKGSAVYLEPVRVFRDED